MNEFPSGPRVSRWEGIRVYLLGLALVGAIPLVLLNIYRVTERHREQEQDERNETMNLARGIAARLDERVRTVEALLLGVSATVRPFEAGRAWNDSLLRRVAAASGNRFTSIAVLDSQGTVVGSSVTGSRLQLAPGSYAGRGYFQVAKRTRGFVVGEARRSQVLPDSNWIVVLALALTDQRNRFLGTVSTSVRLDSITELAESSSRLGETPVITVIDTSGVVLSRSADAEKYIGRKRFQSGFPVDTQGTETFTGLDGVARVTSFTHAVAAPWQVNVGVPVATLAAESRRTQLQDLALLFMAAGLTSLVAYAVGQRITRPIEALAEDARALARGAVATRARASGPREVRLLSDAFNQMAETVERRNASLADSERRYRMLFDSNPLPMWAWDANSMQLTAVNEASIEKYGYRREEFLARRIVDLIAPGEMERFTAARLPFAEARQSAGLWMHRKASGELMEMEVITTSSRRLGRDSWLSVGIDVTARRAAERALAVSEEQLRQSQKMEAIGAFAGGISHDFNNLLTGMLGYCDLALSELPANSSAHDDVTEVRALAMRGAELTRQILAVSRKQVVQPALLNPNDVLRGLDRLLRRLIGEHIDLHTTLSEGVDAIHADAGQLEQVMLNLCANARDAMPHGGTLRIETARATTESVVAHGLEADTSWMMIAVTDTGEGMPEDVRLRVFEPFFTTKDRGKGTGLGLALAYAMVDQSGGTIRVESTVGQGTTFRLFFPVAEGLVPQEAPEFAADVQSDGTETILLAEDEESVRAVAAAALERHGYRVLVAPDGEAALSLAQSFPHTIDLLLTDAIMPRMNGRELAEHLRALRPTIRVLFASGYTDDVSLLQGIRTDELSFLQKPFTAVDLVRRVRSVLDEPTRVS